MYDDPGRRRINTQMEMETLRTCLPVTLISSYKARRNDWIKPINSSLLFPEEILHDKMEVEDGDKKMGGNARLNTTSLHHGRKQ